LSEKRFWKFSVLWIEIAGWFCQNCFLPGHKNFLSYKMTKNFFILFRTWREKRSLGVVTKAFYVFSGTLRANMFSFETLAVDAARGDKLPNEDIYTSDVLQNAFS